MPIEIVTVPCLQDNYAYIVKGPDGVCLIDAPQAAPIIAALASRGWQPDSLLITHHHNDHVAGVDELRALYGCQVMGPAAEQARLPDLDRALSDGDVIGADDAQIVALSVPGHTMGHMAYYFPAAAAVFTADSLMALGCGRLFEGTPEMMWDSLSKLAALPGETMVYSGHEYTAANAKFALTIEPDNQALISRAEQIDKARSQGQATVPCELSLELATNPFLRASNPQIKQLVGMTGAPDAQVFAEIRRRKDNFRA